MKNGKLPKDILSGLLAGTWCSDRVLIGPRYGEDAAAFITGDSVMVAAGDPITFATEKIGWYAVTVNANDIAVTGAVPRYFLATILLPSDSPESTAIEVFGQISDACRSLEISLIGGHTEITPAVNQVVVSGVMLGETSRHELVKTGGAIAGDDVLLIGHVAIEGTAILAREAADRLTAAGIGAGVIEKSAGLLDNPGISVVDYARKLTSTARIHSMHDPTEGGLASALREMAQASGVGMLIDKDRIKVLPECRTICDALGLNPMGLIASGCLLAACDHSDTEILLKAFDGSPVPACKIGTVVSETELRYMDGSDLPIFERDEIASFFDRGE